MIKVGTVILSARTRSAAKHLTFERGWATTARKRGPAASEKRSRLCWRSPGSPALPRGQSGGLPREHEVLAPEHPGDAKRVRPSTPKGPRPSVRGTLSGGRAQ